jgi:hypothetical protein
MLARPLGPPENIIAFGLCPLVNTFSFSESPSWGNNLIAVEVLSLGIRKEIA